MENLDSWKLAGKISGEILQYARSLVKDGALLLDVAEKVDERIAKLGAKPAFPINISLDNCAAHYTPYPNDKTAFNGNVVKVDIGVHVNGCIGDTALTVDLSKKNSELVKASEQALANAIKVAKPGVAVCEIGEVVEESITSKGFKPIKNLSGHELKVFNLHTGITIPNYNNAEKTLLEDGMVVAIEPFATDGAGMIMEGRDAEIFSLVQKRNPRSQITRDVLKSIETFDRLPFATRWLVKKFPLFKINFALKELAGLDAIRLYPPLMEVGKGLVSQTEHTILVKDKPIVLTQRDE